MPIFSSYTRIRDINLIVSVYQLSMESDIVADNPVAPLTFPIRHIMWYSSSIRPKRALRTHKIPNNVKVHCILTECLKQFDFKGRSRATSSILAGLALF
jgi:hypothetical protein